MILQCRQNHESLAGCRVTGANTSNLSISGLTLFGWLNSIAIDLTVVLITFGEIS